MVFDACKQTSAICKATPLDWCTDGSRGRAEADRVEGDQEWEKENRPWPGSPGSGSCRG